jgi:hypothetical protein
VLSKLRIKLALQRFAQINDKSYCRFVHSLTFLFQHVRHQVRVPVNEAQQQRGGGVGLPASAFPMADSGDRQPEALGEFVLR